MSRLVPDFGLIGRHCGQVVGVPHILLREAEFGSREEASLLIFGLLKYKFYGKTVSFSRFELVGVDCEHAEHLTTTTAYDAKSYFRLRIVFIGLE